MIPRCNNSCVIDFPIPVPPPVTMATFPLNNPFLKTLEILVEAVMFRSCDLKIKIKIKKGTNFDG
jgi:hypothetical protein